MGRSMNIVKAQWQSAPKQTDKVAVQSKPCVCVCGCVCVCVCLWVLRRCLSSIVNSWKSTITLLCVHSSVLLDGVGLLHIPASACIYSMCGWWCLSLSLCVCVCVCVCLCVSVCA